MSKKNKLFIVNFNQILVICIVNLFGFIIIARGNKNDYI